MKNKAVIMEELISMAANNLASIPKDVAPTFHVPENYFEHLPAQIINNINASSLETTFQTDIDKAGPFSIPNQYFESISETILQKIQAMNQIIESEARPLFGEDSKEMPYHLPENYFNNLENNISQKLGLNAADAITEIETISPLLATLKSKVSYQAPNSYFNAAELLEKVQLKTIQSKVVEHPAVKSIKWARWAAAASIILIFSVSGFQFLNSNLDNNSNAEFEKSIAKISDARIKDWLSNNIDEADMTGLGDGLANNKKNTTTSSTIDNLTEKQIEDLENEIW